MIINCSIFKTVFISLIIQIQIGTATKEHATNISTENQQECLSLWQLPGNGTLTQNEIQRFNEDICVTQDALFLTYTNLDNPQNGIPDGVDCEATRWCDSYEICSTICKPGSVVVSDWLKFAIKTQYQLSYAQPFCYQTFLGTHNSAITLANGYGNEDLQYEQYLRYIKWILWNRSDQVFRTDNQWLSLTDQMNLGVRFVEVDVHWVEGALRVAHCGGFHVPLFDDMIHLVNIIAKALGHPVHWDTETLGCKPSLSAIPVGDQVYFIDDIREIRDWLNATENKDDFIILFLDAQVDLEHWGKLQLLLDQIDEVFPIEWIMTPPEKNALFPGMWPSVNTLKKLGKRLVIMTDAQWGVEIANRIFYREGPEMCGWTEPSIIKFVGPPQCEFSRKEKLSQVTNRTMEGVIFRPTNCALKYGPFNCEFQPFEDNLPPQNTDNLPYISDCSVNIPSPDSFTPALAASYIWSWAPNHPDNNSGGCVVINARDGRWYSKECTTVDIPVACRLNSGPRQLWTLSYKQPKGNCPQGYLYDVPRTGKENLDLRQLMQKKNVKESWLPIFGPIWALPNTIHNDQLVY